LDYRAPRRHAGSSADTEEVSQEMRKYLALALVAGLALSSAFGLTGCSKKESTSSTTETTTPTTGGTMGADTTGGMDTTKHDSM
jgi:hypothetical protein